MAISQARWVPAAGPRLQVVVEEVEEKEKIGHGEEDAGSDVVASSRTEWDSEEDEEDDLVCGPPRTVRPLPAWPPPAPQAAV